MEEKINICVLDFQEDDIEKIKDKGFEVYNGSADTKVEVTHSGNNSTKYCLLNYDYPPNLHEYNILFINMINERVVPYYFEEHNLKKVSTDGEIKLEVSRPTNIFDPRPLSLHYLNKELKDFSLKPSIIVVFADRAYETKYQPVQLGKFGIPKHLEILKKSNYSFWPNIPLKHPKYGFKSNIVATGGIKKLLQDFNEFEYHQTFYSATVWCADEGKSVKDPNFQSLIENNCDEVISYAHSYENTEFFVFPDIKKKGEFIIRFLTEVAPQILPDLFSYNSEINWLNDHKYWLPGHTQLVQQRKSEIDRHKNELLKIETSIKTNFENFKFLHDLITETDEKLVDAVLFMLKYIGFDNALKVDETNIDGLLEEDIQIESEDKLLVIEVKGIGGTSKDNECSQVSKNRLRRMKERKTTEVYGLYIVNHERFKPPHFRSNPPFNETQIQDSINDDRGLLTTWDLYKLYFDIDNGIIQKEEIQENFFQYGLVNFRKNLVQIAKIDKIYKNRSIASFELDGIELRNGDLIISEKNGFLKKHNIISIQQNKTDVDTVMEGRVGILTDTPIEINSKIFKKDDS